MTNQLPDDVLAFIEQQAEGVPTRSAPNGDAYRLLKKYKRWTPEPGDTVTWPATTFNWVIIGPSHRLDSFWVVELTDGLETDSVNQNALTLVEKGDHQ